MKDHIKTKTLEHDEAVKKGFIVPRQKGQLNENDDGAMYRRITHWLDRNERQGLDSMVSSIPDALMVQSKDSKGHPIIAVYRPSSKVRLGYFKNPGDDPDHVERPSAYIRG